MNENMLARVFEGRTVRFLPRDEEVLVPLPDIAKALDYDRYALMQMMDRNKEVFEEGKVVITLPSEGGPQKTTCLTRDGVVGLLMKLSTGRIKDPAKRTLIVNFQRWAIRTIGEVMRGTYRARETLETEEMARLIEGFNELQGGFLQTLRVFGDVMKRYAGVRKVRRPAKVIRLDEVRPAQPETGAGITDPGSEMLTTHEVAVLLGVSSHTVTRRIRQGIIQGGKAVSGRRGGRNGMVWMVPAGEVLYVD